MKVKINNDFDIVSQEMNHLYIVQERIPNINDVNIYSCKYDEIGERSNKFTYRNYHEVYKLMLEERKYNILLNDESMISFYYAFNELGEIIQHNLSFIPSVDIEILLSENLTLHDQLLIFKNARNYIRIDFDLTGKDMIVHTDVHMHYGIYYRDENLTQSELRIPLEGIIYPNEFIYIILKYLYCIDNELLAFLISDNYVKRSRLEIIENDKLVMTFNRKNYAES